MARRSNAANNVHINGDMPPPSTIAAQIVQNQTRPRNASQSGQQAILRHLCHEIIHDKTAEPESDININAQLIRVVTEAGLWYPTTENPFANWDELRSQALDSIRIIEATVDRQPAVLLMSTAENGPPVLLRLIASTLSICGRTKFQDLPVVELFNCAIRALQATVSLWPNACNLQGVLQACVDDILLALETSPDGRLYTDLTIPPTRSVRKLWQNSANSIAVPEGYSISIGDPARAFMISVQITQVTGLNDAWRRDAHRRIQCLMPRLQKHLEMAGQWEQATTSLLHYCCDWIVLASFLQKAAKTKLSIIIQTAMARSLVDAFSNQDRQAHDIILPACRQLGGSGVFDDLSESLKKAIAIWLFQSLPDDELPESIISLRNDLHQGNATAVDELEATLRLLARARAPLKSYHRMAKRRKTVNSDSNLVRDNSARHLSKLLSGNEQQDLASTPENLIMNYGKLSEIEQCNVWQCLTDMASHAMPQAARVISALLGYPNLHGCRKPRVLTMQAIRACVEVSEDPDLVTLATSRFGQLCLQSLHSSLRELRIAAGQTLPSFLRDTLPTSIRKQNRQVALEYLRSVSDRDVPSEQETLVGAWTQVGLACSEEEMNLVLLRLIQYLGHSNSLINALAFSEIEKIAAIKKIVVEQLFKPFSRTIAMTVVRDLPAKPQIAKQVCDLQGIHVNDFLVLAQKDILPTLVLTKNHTVLRTIAEARGDGSSIRQICLRPIWNLAGIISLLLNRFGPEGEAAAFACLVDVDASFRELGDLSDLVKIQADAIACEMLRHCGDQDELRKPRSHQAFQMLVALTERSPGQRKPTTKASSRAIASFFEIHILGILTHLSTMLVGPIAQSTHEKVRCLRGIIEMFTLAKRNVAIALPQIRACLQSGLDQPELREVAFVAWLSLIPVLESDDIAQIVGETFALILTHWSHLTTDVQKMVYDTVAELVKAHNTILQDQIATLPSLNGIPVLSKFAAEFERFRAQENVESRCKAFVHRLQAESKPVVLQALEELVSFLDKFQDFVHETAATEHPSPVLPELLRALLDVTVEYAHTDPKAAENCGKALGIVGCLDPNRVETVRQKRQVFILSNFESADEVVEWVMALFEGVLVKTFKSVTNARHQGFLAYVMQELLKSCGFTEMAVLRPRSSQMPGLHQEWKKLPEHVRTTLVPFLTSRYHLTSINGATAPRPIFQGFSPEASHDQWIKFLTSDLVNRSKGQNANMIFPLFWRIVRFHDVAIARWLLPYVTLNIVLEGTVAEVKSISDSILAVLSSRASNAAQHETIRLCSENIFAIIDYMTSWIREKRRMLGDTRAAAYKTGDTPADFDEEKDMAQIETVEKLLASIPAAVIANQAIECRSYARALFHWEQYIRQSMPLIPTGQQSDSAATLYERLLDIYAQIDEPDGLEGISAHLPIITEQQRAMNHAKAGRWTAAQAWYELQLSTHPEDAGLQTGLLNCLKETGQYGPLLSYADSFLLSTECTNKSPSHILSHLSSAVEACWMTEDLQGLEKRLRLHPQVAEPPFNIRIGTVIVYALRGEEKSFTDEITAVRKSVVEGLSTAGTDSLQTCHDELRKLHVLHEIESLMTAPLNSIAEVVATLDKRLTAMGSYTQDKQNILGLRRTIMRIRQGTFRDMQIGASWVTSAKLARQAQNTSRAYNAILKAVQCGNRDAKLEEARLLWHEGHQRQAIQSLESAVKSGLFDEQNFEAATSMTDSTVGNGTSNERVVNGQVQNKLSAKAHLLLAKWLDASGQSQTNDMTERYQHAAQRFQHWEKGHYYLGKHYSKLLDAQKALPKEKRSQAFLTGEMTKLVIDNNLRSLPFGNKYWHETIPRLFTLWLELGSDVEKRTAREEASLFEKRSKSLQACNRQVQKYFERLPAYVFYNALPQLISRITHPHPDIWKQLCNIITRIVSTHPSQALWSLLAVIKARDDVRVERGREVLNRMKDPKNKVKPDSAGLDLRSMIAHSQRLSEGLLRACETPVDPRTTSVNLFTDLGFNHKLAPSNLVVPIEATLTASSPAQATSDDIRKHKSFAQDKVTIQSFRENVMVLSSLQRPRKITVRGSDGKEYGLLCKPKDDLRKDQRLMEFNGIINRALKRNTESSKRRLYIKTYAVTPLSEESGTIEWVEGIRPIRDILLNIYARKGNRPNYNVIRKDLEEACASQKSAHLFASKVLVKFPPSLHEWFSENHPQPDLWFAARLRYARSAAVMSMTGYILGLGDRHGENILLEESTGGVFHVDFNCLFDKGLTFDKPELVPFRLTHNMVDAMGPHGYEGPYRKSCELTLSLLRQERDTLMTVLETFLYDPTTDFVGKKKRSTVGVPETPAEILESVATKLRGLLRGETVPLSVDGHVDALIEEATDAFRLASMYIGWCSFL